MQDAILHDQPAVHGVEPATAQPAAEPQPALPLRADTILGVCEAIGEEFGFHPNWLRVVFAAAVLWNPVVPIAIYLVIGAFAALARWLYPRPAAAASAPAAHQAADHRPANADHETDCLAA